MSNDLGTTIRTKLQEDPDFRDRLKEDPRAVVAEIVGEDVPDELEIVVVENGAKKFHIVLPPTDIDINDLDATVGGFGSWRDVVFQPMF